MVDKMIEKVDDFCGFDYTDIYCFDYKLGYRVG